MNTRKTSAFLLASAFAMFVCGSQTAQGQTAPCSLLTPAQVSSVTGANAGAGSPISTTGCSWKATGGAKIMVTVSMQNAKMFEGVKALNVPGATKTSVSGVGDEAIFTGSQGFSSLWVKKGSAYVLLRIYGVAVDDAQAKLKTLASSAVSKL